MSCPTYGPLIGGYVLGALEPEETEEVRRHLAVCPDCGPEAERLKALPGLLDRIEPADVPPPTVSPELEERVLDRFARERRQRQAPRRRLGVGRRVALIAAAGLAAIVLALLIVPEDDEGDAAYASVRLSPLVDAAKASASAELDQVPAGTRIRLETRGLRSSAEYEVWCIRTDGRWVSGGTFWADRDGRTRAELTAAVRPGDYHRMVVTRRPESGGESTRGPTVLRGALRY